ncbi:hypothetical protein VHEMI04518 [[Torrubiella] hemipterigena]|uniref:Secreted protein n=1 Tax=[Torrubiella] hemipterigena TaxID=1531966 RepID=A0A0A1SVI1_9HYPO|nr:hypothetical protein VHEMI04518 [[Torrubiella] hemipterigena]
MTNLKVVVVAAWLTVASATAYAQQQTAIGGDCDIPVDATVTITNYCQYPMHLDGKAMAAVDDVSDIAGKVLKPWQSITRKIKPCGSEKPYKIFFSAPKDTIHEKSPLVFSYALDSCKDFIGGWGTISATTWDDGLRWDIGHGGNIRSGCKKPRITDGGLSAMTKNQEHRYPTSWRAGAGCNDDEDLKSRSAWMTVDLCSENKP